jgi:uncharacterized membrane protein YphA (DoxX/SURF4 family)
MLPLFYPSILITAMFLLSGFEKIFFFPRTTSKFAKKMKIPIIISQLIIIAVIVLEIVAPLVITSYTFTGKRNIVPFYKSSVIALIVFTIFATIIYHNPFVSRDKYYVAIANLSTIGGLLALYLCA